MTNELMTAFAFVGILILSLVAIMGLSLLISFAVSSDSDERAWFRWLTVSILYAFSIALWSLN